MYGMEASKKKYFYFKVLVFSYLWLVFYAECNFLCLPFLGESIDR